MQAKIFAKSFRSHCKKFRKILLLTYVLTRYVKWHVRDWSSEVPSLPHRPRRTLSSERTRTTRFDRASEIRNGL